MEEILYTIALMRLMPYQSQVLNTLLEVVGSAKEVFEARNNLQDIVPEINPRLAQTISQMEKHLEFAEKEMEFTRKKHIKTILRNDEMYPARLRECVDSPTMLFYRGTADLNSKHIVSMVGTRKATAYGKRFCESFLRELSELCPDILIVSGLAYGIDICSHRQSLANGMQTIAVLAHGLDRIYPNLHRQTAIEMLSHGGLLTEYPSGSVPDRINFISRNRIVAGMSDATIVVESAERGGSLITARIASDYGRDVFAVPGRIGDVVSEGCNMLIRDSRAGLLLSAKDFMDSMGWQTQSQKDQPIQRELFVNLSPEQQLICNALNGDEGKSMSQLAIETNLSISRLSGLLFDMEMQGIIRQLSGGLYRML